MANISNPNVEEPGVGQEAAPSEEAAQKPAAGEARTVEPAAITEEAPKGPGSPISNEAYDVIAALQSKLEGLEAYRDYACDGNRELWEKLAEAEVPLVEQLLGELEHLVRDGKLRKAETAEAHH